MKTRILALFAIMMLGLSSFCLAHVASGSVQGTLNTSDGQKIAIYTQEGYSVATVLEYHVNYPLENRVVIEALNGRYLTELGRVRIKDLHTGSSDIIIQIEGVNMTEKDALRWVVNGGVFE